MTFAARPTFTSRDVRAGCFVCHGYDAHWHGGNAQGVAARHHDATGHATWCDVHLSIRYGREAPDARQADIEDSIAAAAASSGGRQPTASLPDPDAPADAPAGVSAHEAAQSRRAGHGTGARGRHQPETARE